MKEANYWESAEYLKNTFDYTFEMMPLLFALSKSTKCNINEASKLIQEGKVISNICEEHKESKANCLCGKSPKRSKSKSPEPPAIHSNGNSPLDLSKRNIIFRKRILYENSSESDDCKKSSEIFKPYSENVGRKINEGKIVRGEIFKLFYNEIN
jgi:hypothetical protein